MQFAVDVTIAKYEVFSLAILIVAETEWQQTLLSKLCRNFDDAGAQTTRSNKRALISSSVGKGSS